MEVPRAVDLRCPVPLDQLVGDAGQGGVLDHRRGVQYAADRQPGGRRRGDQAGRGIGLGDVAALHCDVGPGLADPLNGRPGPRIGLGAGGEHDAPAARRRHPRGKEQPQAA